MFRQNGSLNRTTCTTSFLIIAVTLLLTVFSCFAPSAFSCPVDFTEGQAANIDRDLDYAQTSDGQPAALQKNESSLLPGLILNPKNRSRSSGAYQPPICDTSIYTDKSLAAAPFHLSAAPYASDLSSAISIKTTRKRE